MTRVDDAGGEENYIFVKQKTYGVPYGVIDFQDTCW